MKLLAFHLLSVLVLFGFLTVSAESLRESINTDYEENLAELFVHFHENPELSFREFETAKRMAKELRGLGYEVTEGVGQTGVVAVLKNGEGPTVLLRADMDGLPVTEKSGLSYASKARQVDIHGVEQSVMHACGHDVHITSLVGTARQLVARRDQWSGTLVLICQPAEEIGSGARAMLKDGLYERFPKPDYAVGFHVASKIPSGKIVVQYQTVSSSVDSVDILVHGVGTHGAAPHSGIDPVLVASQIVVSLQSIVSRTISPMKPGVVTVGSIHGGTKHNIIGNRVEMQLTVRADDAETRETLLDSIDRVADGVARSLGVPEHLLPEVIRSPTDMTPPNVNDEPTARILKSAFVDHFKKGTIIDLKREMMGGEDFAYYGQPERKVKSVFFNVGGSVAEDTIESPPHHSPIFKVQPEPAIKTGVEAMVVAAMTLMNGE
ncbi:MAG: amidohydrolase [Verrucomicrobia bacterium]|nr:amidohydrolase [Verrucomicrobiota bacterium]